MTMAEFKKQHKIISKYKLHVKQQQQQQQNNSNNSMNLLWRSLKIMQELEESKKIPKMAKYLCIIFSFTVFSFWWSNKMRINWRDDRKTRWHGSAAWLGNFRNAPLFVWIRHIFYSFSRSSVRIGVVINVRFLEFFYVVFAVGVATDGMYYIQ